MASDPERRDGKAAATPAAPAARDAWRMIVILHGRMFAQLDRDADAAVVVPATWFDVLATLDATPGKRLRLRDLADAVLLTRAGLTRVLDRIEGERLIRREACADDGRGSDAVLTPAGEAALRKAWPVYGRAVADRFAAHLPAAAADALVGALRGVLLANGWLPGEAPVEITVRRRPK